MTHINYKNPKSRTERTPREWLAVGSQIAKVANEWSSRTDLVAFIGEGATSGKAAALFTPDIAEIEIDITKAFGFGVNPESIDMTTRASQYEFATATGAILHEAFHARFSQWDIKAADAALQKDEFAALILLEEGRIERLGLMLDAKYLPFLRSSAIHLAIGDLEGEALTQLNIASAAQLVGLVQARVIAGILKADEVEEIVTMAKSVLGEELFSRLSEICAEFQSHTNHWRIDTIYHLAQEWARLIREAKEEAGEGEGEGGGEGEQSDEGEGEGIDISKVLEAMKDARDVVEIATMYELNDQQESEEWAEEVKERNSKSKERRDSISEYEDVFGVGTEEMPTTASRSRLVESRTPTSAERKAAVTVANLLDKAKYRERDITVVSSQVPQGRLRVREAMQNSASRSQGRMATANPWQQKVRKHTDEPTLSVGVMVDISGSMGSAMEPMATTAWVMSEAVRRVQGKAAMVYYGEGVFPTLKAGQHLDTVNVYTAHDGTEKFDKAFKALNGSLSLLDGRGVRMLVVVSDGVYTSEESKKAKAWLKRCDQEGVAVLWLTMTERGAYGAENICNGTNAVVVSGSIDPTTAAVEIGRAAAKALGGIAKAAA